MALIPISHYPISAQLEHDGTPVGTYEDEWGVIPVYRITRVLWQNLSGVTWTVLIVDENSRQFIQEVLPNETGSKNLPTPQRFNYPPLTFSFTLFRS